MKTLRWIDLPPIWLAAFIGLTWVLSRLLSGLTVQSSLQGYVAAILILLGVGLMVAAAWEMYNARTTIIPHRQPQALVQTGVFRISRNPIYLGDLFVLAGAMTYWGVVLAIPLLWIFVRIIEVRFIEKEEERLKEGFSQNFAQWAKNTRRWL
jgi:protein-S-isoprenylcysteine O-methyltransferase Ste14